MLYARYYLKMIEPVKGLVDAGAYRFTSLSSVEGWEGLKGLAFENLVVNNYPELLPHLHLGGALVTSAAPYRKNAVRGQRGGYQIDLLIQTEGSLCIVEVKRRKEIAKSIIREVDDKVSRIVRPQGVSIRTALVYDGELSSFVETNGYFDALIPFGRLLGR